MLLLVALIRCAAIVGSFSAPPEPVRSGCSPGLPLAHGRVRCQQPPMVSGGKAENTGLTNGSIFPT